MANFGAFAGGLTTGFLKGSENRRQNEQASRQQDMYGRQGQFYDKLAQMMDTYNKTGTLTTEPSQPEQLAGPRDAPAPAQQQAPAMMPPPQAAPWIGGLTPQAQQRRRLPFAEFMGWGR